MGISPMAQFQRQKLHVGTYNLLALIFENSSAALHFRRIL
jgi:hypothetical protein